MGAERNCVCEADDLLLVQASRPDIILISIAQRRSGFGARGEFYQSSSHRDRACNLLNRGSRSVPEDDACGAALAHFTAYRLGFLPGRATDTGRISHPCPEGTVAFLLDQRLFLVQRRGQGPNSRQEQSDCHRLLEMPRQLRAPRRPDAFRFKFQGLEAPRVGKCDAGVLEGLLPVEAQVDGCRRVVAPVLGRVSRDIKDVVAVLLRQASVFQECLQSAYAGIVGGGGQAEVAEAISQVIEILSDFFNASKASKLFDRPRSLAVEGMNCAIPSAPFGLTASGRNRLSVQISRAKKSGGRSFSPAKRASALHMSRLKLALRTQSVPVLVAIE